MVDEFWKTVTATLLLFCFELCAMVIWYYLLGRLDMSELTGSLLRPECGRRQNRRPDGRTAPPANPARTVAASPAHHRTPAIPPDQRK